MKRFTVLTFVLFLVLAIQPIFYHVAAIDGEALDGTQWNVVLFEYDAVTGEWLGSYPAAFTFGGEGGGIFGFLFGDIIGETEYDSTPLRFSIAWSANLYVNGDFGVNFWFTGRATNDLQYMTGSIRTDYGLFYTFIATRAVD